MVKNNMRIKNTITRQDKINAIEKMVSFYFVGGDYTPFYKEMGEVVAIIHNFIEGVEFDEDENIYDCYTDDGELRELVNLFLMRLPDVENEDDKYKETKEISDGLYDMMSILKLHVRDMVEFDKQKYIHSQNSLDLSKIVQAANVIIDSFETFSKINFKYFTDENFEKVLGFMDKLSKSDFELTTDNITNVIKNAAEFDFDKAGKEIIDAKNKEIRELKKKLNEKDKSIHRLK